MPDRGSRAAGGGAGAYHEHQQAAAATMREHRKIARARKSKKGKASHRAPSPSYVFGLTRGATSTWHTSPSERRLHRVQVMRSAAGTWCTNPPKPTCISGPAIQNQPLYRQDACTHVKRRGRERCGGGQAIHTRSRICRSIFRIDTACRNQRAVRIDCAQLRD